MAQYHRIWGISGAAVLEKVSAIRVLSTINGEYTIEDATSPSNGSEVTAIMATFHEPVGSTLPRVGTIIGGAKITATQLKRIINIIVTANSGFIFTVNHIESSVFNVTHPPTKKVILKVSKWLDPEELDLVQKRISEYYS